MIYLLIAILVFLASMYLTGKFFSSLVKDPVAYTLVAIYSLAWPLTVPTSIIFLAGLYCAKLGAK